MNITKELMHRNVHVIGPEDSVLLAYEIMKEKGIRHLPVVDSNHKLVGILSDRDIQRAMIVEKMSEYNQKIIIPKDLIVSDFMSWPVYTVNKETPIKTVTEIMIREKVSALVVENNNSDVIGIVTTNDLLAHLLQIIGESDKSQKWTQWTLAQYLNRSH